MNSDVICKLDELISLLDNSEDVKRMVYLKEKLMNNKLLLDKISLVKDESNHYSNEYISLKNEIISSDDYKEYKSIENDLYYLVQDINAKLKTLLKGDIDENN